MADEVYLFTENYAYDASAAASTSGTSVGTNTPDKAIDALHNTYWETTDPVVADLKIDLGTARTIDSLWFKHSTNILTYRLYHSPDDIVYTPVDVAQNADVDGYTLYLSFTPAARRYWRLDIVTKNAGNILIYEVLLMAHQLTLDDVNTLPSDMKHNIIDRGGVIYQLVDGTSVTMIGETEKGKAEVSLIFDHTPLANRDDLYDLFVGPPRRPNMTLYPDRDNRKQDIYQVVWPREFPLTYTLPYKGSGFSGTLTFTEI